MHILPRNLEQSLKTRDQAVSLLLRHDLKDGSHECVELSRGVILNAFALCRAEDVDLSSIGRGWFANDQSPVREGVNGLLQRGCAQVQFAG
jgi:hypothetical protein